VAEPISDAAADFLTDGRMPAFAGESCELTIAEIAALTGATLLSGTPPDRRISNVAPLDTAGAADISFLDDAKHTGELVTTRAGACLMAPHFAPAAPSGLVVLLTDEPYRAFVTVARALFPSALRPSSLFDAVGRTAGAQVHSLARLEAGVTIDPLAMIGPRAEIGAGTVIAAGAGVGPDVRIGRQCAVGAGATILHAFIGDRVIVHPGARIGQDGFGYLSGPKGHEKVPQTGRVIIQDDAEIGANAVIDRGSIRDTIIGEGSKVDSLVQIAHNVSIGRHCLIAAQAGIARNVTVGDFVTIGRQAAVAGDIAIGEGAVVAERSRVISDVPGSARFPGMSGGGKT
jgi:UDP-3-O-[3-hydroxymyristoyl] glucosamine N-acyltransferase